MFDFDATKLIIIGIAALIFIGPKDLPRVLRQVGQFVGKMRRMASEFQGQFMDAMKDSEMADLKQDMQKIAEQAKADIAFDPGRTTERELRDALEKKPDETNQSAPVAVTDPDSAVFSVDLPPDVDKQPAIEADATKIAMPANDATTVGNEPRKVAHNG